MVAPPRQIAPTAYPNELLCMNLQVKSLLSKASLPSIEARILLAYASGRNRTWLAAHAEATLDPASANAFQAFCKRRVRGEPIAYIVGEREFYGLRLNVNPAVMIPRPETELLVDLALARLPTDQKSRVLDLGTGSGAIAVAIAHERPLAEVIAVDASPEALAIAEGNVRSHDLANVELIESDWFSGLGRRVFDVIVSNPPYIAENDRHLVQGDLRFEPRVALTPGGDGLPALETIIGQARRHLVDRGWLLLEHGFDQADACRDLMQSYSLSNVLSHADLAGILRATSGRC